MCAGNNYLGNLVAFGIFHVCFLPLGLKKLLTKWSRQKDQTRKAQLKKPGDVKKSSDNFFFLAKALAEDFFMSLGFFS